MSAIYVLVMIFMYGIAYAGDYDDKASCETAGRAIAKAYSGADFVCSPKSKDQTP